MKLRKLKHVRFTRGCGRSNWVQVGEFANRRGIGLRLFAEDVEIGAFERFTFAVSPLKVKS